MVAVTGLTRAVSNGRSVGELTLIVGRAVTIFTGCSYLHGGWQGISTCFRKPITGAWNYLRYGFDGS